ncbi:MAG: hypothetical protein HY052_04125 [Proteobacteria bacterium]|nr:hypothetical protein [Pseudomonadota bacterium]
MTSVIPAFAAGDGYSGLIAPPAPNSSAPGTEAGNGYAGLIPDRPDARGSADNTPEEQQPVTATPTTHAPMTSADLKMLALKYGLTKKRDMAAEFTKPLKLSDKQKEVLAKPRPRIENMLPAEYAARKNIEGVMPKVRDKSISPEEQKKSVSLARQRLGALAEGFRYKNNVSDDVYKKMGLPDIFIKEEREGNSKALSLLNEALKELDQY